MTLDLTTPATAAAVIVPSALALLGAFWLALRDDPDRERRRLRDRQLRHHLHTTTTERR